MMKYKNGLIVLMFFLFVLLMNYLGRVGNKKEYEKQINKMFSGVVVGHNDYRTFRLKIKVLKSNYTIELSDVSTELYNYSEEGDTILKPKIGNECVLLKKDTSMILKCYNYK